MESFVFILLILLIFALILTVFHERRGLFLPRLFRILITAGAIIFYAFWIFRKSVTPLIKDSVALQIINKLPQPVDFYVITVPDKNSRSPKLQMLHSGKIRPDYFRVEYLRMTNSTQYWLVGYVGKKNMVYFSQHAVPNKNIDQMVEVQNYINQSQKLSEKAAGEVEQYQKSNNTVAIWITLSLLLIFLNSVLLLRKRQLAVS